MISIDYSTFIIYVPKSYTQLVSLDPQTGLEVRQINLTTFSQDLANLQDDELGMWASTAFEYTAPIQVGGVQLAPVVVILSPYTVEFEDGQYAVQLNGANTNLQDKVIVNQVSIRPNNSAGLTFSDIINEQSYQGASVWIDSTDGLPGTQFPRGTPTDEVNNITDAVTIANRIGLSRFNLRGTITAVGDIGISRFQMTGITPTNAVIIAATDFNVQDSAFDRLAIVGSITGRGSFQNCSVAKTLGLAGVQGIFDNCGIAGNLVLDNVTTETIVFKDCISAVPGLVKPILNCNNAAASIEFRRYSGGVDVINFTNASGNMTMDLMGAEIVINSTSCTNGQITTRGVGRVIDENGTLLPIGVNTINGNLILNNYSLSPDLLLENNIKLSELYQMDGLDDVNPVSITPTQKTSGNITIDIGGDGENIATLTRQ